MQVALFIYCIMYLIHADNISNKYFVVLSKLITFTTHNQI